MRCTRRTPLPCPAGAPKRRGRDCIPPSPSLATALNALQVGGRFSHACARGKRFGKLMMSGWLESGRREACRPPRRRPGCLIFRSGSEPERDHGRQELLRLLDPSAGPAVLRLTRRLQKQQRGRARRRPRRDRVREPALRRRRKSAFLEAPGAVRRQVPASSAPGHALHAWAAPSRGSRRRRSVPPATRRACATSRSQRRTRSTPSTASAGTRPAPTRSII